MPDLIPVSLVPIIVEFEIWERGVQHASLNASSRHPFTLSSDRCLTFSSSSPLLLNVFCSFVCTPVLIILVIIFCFFIGTAIASDQKETKPSRLSCAKYGANHMCFFWLILFCEIKAEQRHHQPSPPIALWHNT